MESLLKMEEKQLYMTAQREHKLFFNIVCFTLAGSIIHGWTVFMDRPICVSVISDAVTQNAKTFMLVEQDCHFYGNILC